MTTAYYKHWQRLEQLLGPEEAAAERARVAADERADRLRAKIARFRREIPRFRERLQVAEREGRVLYARKLREWIAYRERAIAEYEASEVANE